MGLIEKRSINEQNGNSEAILPYYIEYYAFSISCKSTSVYFCQVHPIYCRIEKFRHKSPRWHKILLKRTFQDHLRFLGVSATMPSRIDLNFSMILRPGALGGEFFKLSTEFSKKPCLCFCRFMF